ncbi:Sialate O-acetylesterase [Candidatus Koribacter versatilis Ellin345]|uniref:Sialate O-acetylesterase n=1 Tax=Koribacter versatilis (strain Ellin345) TaxID=204669 RepID=Q1IR02_KORVE|nr:sialate O-acetylesterase [Candidatus Koribacter versatilis]ABF40698.1 Sialate O-acetylesterase [Candidatus Koribacter versatilis Ellin345]
MRFSLKLIAIVLCLASCVFAEVSLPAVLSDGAVLQRGMPIHFFGRAAPGEAITISLNKQSKSTTADYVGRWHLYLAPEAAGGPYDATVKGSNTITVHDVLIGDVWVASGQSNMEYPMEGWGGTPKQNLDEFPKANFPTLRFFQTQHAYSDHPLMDIPKPAKWVACTPETAKKFSAVAYYFAKNLIEKEKVPVGIMEADWGGSVAEAWTSLDGLSSKAGLMPIFANRATMMDKYVDEAEIIGPQEQRLKDEAKAKGQPEPSFPWHPDPHSWAPSELYNAMISPLTPYPIRGVIWYQGESNSAYDRAPHYAELFQTMIRDWRNHWGVGDFPFLFVQISAYKSSEAEHWGSLRQTQLESLALRNTGMAVTIDVGNPDDVHPTDKVTVGSRLALAARALSYGEKIEYSGPLPRQVTREEKALRISFDHAESLQAGKNGWCGFEVAGTDGKFSPATAKIEATQIVVSSPAVSEPVSVRYDWTNAPDCFFYNQMGLPASSFEASLPLFH